MLVAAKRRDYYEPAVEVRSAGNAAKKTSLARHKVLIIGAIISLFTFGVYYTSLSASIASKGYQLEKLEKEILKLKTDNERTELMLASMSSLDKVEQVATKKLGMNKPENSQAPMVVAIAGQEVNGENAEPGGSDALQKQQNDSTESPAKQFYTAVISFFEIGKAQASPGTK